MAGLFKNILLLTISLLVALLIAEGLSRLVLPVKYGNAVMALDGGPLPPYTGGEALRPDLSYRVVSQEFDVIVTHTPEGYRGLTRPVAPELIFIGDSFTYGVGLNDKETIPHIYCHRLDLTCVNLGVPGTATVRQVERLEHYLANENWRPRQVKLLFMGMTSALMAGNDLNGNIEELRRAEGLPQEEAPATEAERSLLAKAVDQRTALLEHSNLVRILYYIYGPMLRARLSPDTGVGDLEQALAATRAQFSRLDELAQQYDFRYSIHIIHPMQDVINGTWRETLTAIREIAPADIVVTSTAPVLLVGDSPQQYYYPMDGHLNAEGARIVADYLADLTQEMQQ